MIKRLFIIIALASASVLTAGAQDRIAVLDTDLPKGMDTKVVIPITEKIMEEFVKSKLFIVLDRSFIAKTLSEQAFSVSDLTTGDSAKLAEIGGFLKATYIVVSTVQRLDTTYFLSAKMIEVKSGVIMAQTSVNRDGSIAVLIDMAGELGRNLVASAMGQDAVAATKTPGKAPEQSKAPETAAAPQRETVKEEAAREPEKPKPAKNRFSTISADIGSGVVSAIVTDLDGSWCLYNFKYTDAVDPITATGISYGASGIFPIGLFYLSAGAVILDASSEYYSSTYGNMTSTTQSLDAYVGLGVDLPIGPVLAYAGPRIGFG